MQGRSIQIHLMLSMSLHPLLTQDLWLHLESSKKEKHFKHLPSLLLMKNYTGIFGKICSSANHPQTNPSLACSPPSIPVLLYCIVGEFLSSNLPKATCLSKPHAECLSGYFHFKCSLEKNVNMALVSFLSLIYSSPMVKY